MTGRSIVSLSRHCDDADARWKASVGVHAPAVEHGVDVYGGFGPTPLDALDDLARTLANVLGFERQHGYQRPPTEPPRAQPKVSETPCPAV
jgi:hypothetical protein